MDLFEYANQQNDGLKPLAERMRPQTLNEFIGQEHIVGEGSLLRRAIAADRLGSCIFYGPPGTGKTTLANIIAKNTNSHFEILNAVSSGVADAKRVIEEAKNRLMMYGKKTFLSWTEVIAGTRRSRTACFPQSSRLYRVYRKHDGKPVRFDDESYRVKVPTF